MKYQGGIVSLCCTKFYHSLFIVGPMMIKVLKSSPTSIMAAQKPRANIEACRMIEDMLYEIIPSLDKSKANRLARQLASLQAFQSLDSSTGSELLKLRLKKVSQKLLDIAERKRRASTPTSGVKELSSKVRKLALDERQAKVGRHHILINTVGEPKYNEIISVSNEIKEIRYKSLLWTKFSQQHPCPFEEEELPPASEALPTPIADIYFRTRLIDVMRVVDAKLPEPLNKVPEPRECIVQRTYWGSLLRDAKVKLAAFRKFEMENVKEGDDLSFQCSGICLFSTCRK